MKYLFSVLLFCFCNTFFCQKDSVIDARRYSNGQKSKVIYYYGEDTTQFIKYYKNGQVKDSSWLYSKNNIESPFGISKSYYEDGKLSNITKYGANEFEFTSISYWPDGRISEYEVSPGVRKYYNKKGKLIKQVDLNKNKFIYIPGNYKNKIKKRILLKNQKKQIKIKNNSLISIQLINDTSIITLCKIDELKGDSIYFSKFSYNRSYKNVKGQSILKQDSIFVLSTKQLKAIYYSKHYNGRRNRGAIAAQIIGVELLVGAAITIAVAVREPELGLPVFGGALVSGFVLMQYSKYLYKTMIPKKYDLQEWNIKLKN